MCPGALGSTFRQMGIPLLPRIMSEYVHGETSDIGRNVRICQGVTIGALSVPKDKSEEMRDKKQHPTICLSPKGRVHRELAEQA